MPLLSSMMCTEQALDEGYIQLPYKGHRLDPNSWVTGPQYKICGLSLFNSQRLARIQVEIYGLDSIWWANDEWELERGFRLASYA